MWYVAAYAGGFLSCIGCLYGAGRYAFTHPKAMQPIARRMMHAMMKGGNK